MKPLSPAWHVYMVRTRDGALYTGIATDVARRLAEHRGAGRRGARSLRGRAPLEVVYQRRIGDRGLALRVERRIKHRPRPEKQAIVAERPTKRALLRRLSLPGAAVVLAGAALLLSLAGCSAFQQLSVLRTVTFAFAGISDVRVAGIRIDDEASVRALTVADAARLGAAVVAGQVPLELIAHVSATNPPENTVTARMVDLDWTLFIEDRRMLDGGLAGPVAIAPGRSADVPLTVRLDLLDLDGGGARDLYESALAIAGKGPLRKDLRLELVPTVETPLGAIRYPAPVVVRRAAETR